MRPPRGSIRSGAVIGVKDLSGADLFANREYGRLLDRTRQAVRASGIHRFGHPAGDAVPVGVADIIRQHYRQSDSLARWGGEELIVLTPNTPLSAAAVLAERPCLRPHHAS